MTDFVSTAKGVIQSLVEKHFPAPDRDKINRILGIGPKKSILDELGLKLPKNGSSNDVTNGSSNNGKRKRKAAENMSKKMKTEWDTLGSSDDEDEEKDKNSDYEANHSEPEEEDNSDEDVNSSDFEEEDEEDDFNPFGSGSEDDDDPWAKRAKKKAKKASKKPKNKKAKNGSNAAAKSDPYAHLFPNGHKLKLEETKNPPPPISKLPGLGVPKVEPKQEYAPPKENIDRACQMKAEILQKVEALGRILPPNTLDQLIDELGGPENVSEMTGRKGRVVQDQTSGDVRYESRSEQDVPLETLNLTEKDRFMNAEKDVAIISEAASSGISLQADRRVKNQVRILQTLKSIIELEKKYVKDNTAFTYNAYLLSSFEFLVC